jgi:hypothetical protein
MVRPVEKVSHEMSEESLDAPERLVYKYKQPARPKMAILVAVVLCGAGLVLLAIFGRGMLQKPDSSSVSAVARTLALKDGRRNEVDKYQRLLQRLAPLTGVSEATVAKTAVANFEKTHGKVSCLQFLKRTEKMYRQPSGQ